MIRRLGVPIDFAASTNSRSFSASTSPRTIRAVCIQLVMPMMKTISRKMPGLRPERRAQRVAEQHDDDEQQRQQRQRQEEVGHPHQQPVEPAEIAGEHPDQRAEEEREQHRGHADRQRDPAALQHLGEDVAADVVGAHRMRQRRPGVAGAARR